MRIVPTDVDALRLALGKCGSGEVGGNRLFFRNSMTGMQIVKFLHRV